MASLGNAFTDPFAYLGAIPGETGTSTVLRATAIVLTKADVTNAVSIFERHHVGLTQILVTRLSLRDMIVYTSSYHTASKCESHSHQIFRQIFGSLSILVRPRLD
jgi:hypothetical protein